MRSRYLRTNTKQTPQAPVGSPKKDEATEGQHGAAPSGRGRFIVFEGIDGSGKSTVARRVAAHLQSEGVEVHLTQEPTETAAGLAVRAAIEEHADPISTTFLFVADRIQHQAELEARLAGGETVVCDRYLHSTLAYQSVTLKDAVTSPMEWLQDLHEHVALRPDVVVLLDLPVDVAVSRVASRGASDPFEKEAFLKQVRQAYLALAEADPDLFLVVDATGSEDAVFESALEGTLAALTL